jgi:hypothetical protein
MVADDSLRMEDRRSRDIPEEIDVPVSFPSEFGIQGVSGTQVSGGYVIDAEKDADLSRSERYTTYSDMINNVAIINAGVRFYTNLLGRAQWKFIPADDSAESERVAEAVKHALMNTITPWHRVVRRMAMYRFYGFSVQEWTAKQLPDGSIGFSDISPRAQKTIHQFHTNEHGEVFGFAQESPFTYEKIYLPRWKCVYAVDDTLNDSPEGYGLFRGLYRPAKQLREYQILESHGFQTDLRGIPMAKAPLSKMAELVANGQMTESQMLAVLQPFKTFIANHRRSPSLGMLYDSLPYHASGDNQAPSGTPQWSLELLKGSSQSHQDLARAITRVNMEMARLLGVENILLGESGNGSHALSQDKSLNFGLVVDSTVRELREVVKRDLVTPLFYMNGWDMQHMPTITTDAIQHRDIAAITAALRDLAQAGATILPDDAVVNEVRDLMGLSHAIQPLDSEYEELILPKEPEGDSTTSNDASASD